MTAEARSFRDSKNKGGQGAQRYSFASSLRWHLCGFGHSKQEKLPAKDLRAGFQPYFQSLRRKRHFRNWRLKVLARTNPARERGAQCGQNEPQRTQRFTEKLSSKPLCSLWLETKHLHEQPSVPRSRVGLVH